MDSQLLTLSSQLRGRRRGRVLRSAPCEAGFALLIVVTLLAFIVLLLVGLAAYTRVETSIAGNTQRQAQARENALLALNVALGQLQKHAGPDKRVTATAEALPNRPGTTRYTGVWASDPADDPDGDPLTPLTWLVSGNELHDAQGVPIPLAVAPDSAITPINSVAVVSTNTSRTANDVLARLVPITTTGVPGAATGTTSTIGRYAWWVGDQGVKAPVAVPDTTAAITYPPYDTADARARIRQQISLGAGAADATTGAPVFEPRDANNAGLVAGGKVTSPAQFAFLRNSANAQLGLTRAQQNFHAWSPNNFAVLADTRNGGLRQDLSLQPELLGTEVKSWLDYGSYMETPDPNLVLTTGTLPISPNYSADPLRRRHLMQSGPPMISPVLSFFLLSFNVRTQPTPSGNPSASPQPVQVRLRGAFTLWNPYSSALVPENLRLEIAGLPPALVLDDVTNPTSSGPIPFGSLFGSPVVKFSLPWSASSATPPTDDRHSWLPGRTYSWTIAEDVSGNAPPSGGYPCVLNSQMNPSVFGDGVHRTVPGKIVDGSDQCHLETAAATQLIVTLIAERPSGDVTLGTFTSPQFDPFRTTTRDLGSFTFTPTFVFRLAENDNGPGAWLTTAGLDPRESMLPGDAYTVGTTGHVNGPSPELYENVRTVSAPDRLLDRDVVSFSYNEDTPVFELPRAPVLSLGQLQHFPLAGQRPFAIGNPWIGSTQINGINAAELFDRYFFSGLANSVAPLPVSGSLLLPNPLLKVLRDPATGAPATTADLQGAPNAQSSKFLLQGGAFNLNSTNPTAWAAVLRAVRFPSPQAFSFVDSNFQSGTGTDELALSQSSNDAQFLRFAQSAQETYKFDDPVNGVTYAASTVASPNVPSPQSAANTHFFRRGMKTLSSGVVHVVAERIAQYVSRKHSASGVDGGPFRSLEEFLSPSPFFQDGAGKSRSLLEAAIADAVTSGGESANGLVGEFSSQFLTQADIMTALAPVLFPRSDTFLIRAYGEAVNPATNATEGRAWCEATVQRVPDYMDTSDPAETLPANLVNPLNQQLGRRFKVVSFRWLTRSDI